MLEAVHLALTPFYGWVKALHVLAAIVWAGSTAVAWAYYLKPAFRRVLRHPDDAEARALRNHLMERFDRGAVLEHVAFPILVATALLMIWLGGFDLRRFNHVTIKLWIGALVFVPMECVDIYLSHLGGNKQSIRRSGDMARYERFMRRHWIFFRVTEPIIVIGVPIVVFLAVAKPF